MSLHRLLRQTATIERPGQIIGYDDMGEPEYGPSVNVTARCSLRTVKATETRDGGLVAVDELRIILDPRTTPAPQASEKITVDGTRYTLDGNAWAVRNPRTDQLAYLEARLKLVT